MLTSSRCFIKALPTKVIPLSNMSVPYSIGPEPDRAPNMASEPTEQLKQGKDDVTQPLLDETSEGAPETGLHMQQGKSGPPSVSAAASTMTNPNPHVGHDDKLPDRICPGGYGCDDDN